jgi:3-dehydroquinate synthase
MINDFVITPKELRDVDITECFRGYRRDDVNDLFDRAAATLEWLSRRAQGLEVKPPGNAISARTLRDTDLRDGIRGYDKDEVHALCERAARTIELIQSRITPAASVRHERAQPSLPSFTRIHVELAERSYDVVVGTGALDVFARAVAGRRRVAIVSQARIAELHAVVVHNALATAGVGHETFLVDDGEPAKSMATVAGLCERFARAGVLRDDLVVALGGGVVGDTAGFAASVYHRGIDVYQVPTTLLAMVDSAIGGKTGVNLPEGKNLVGSFHQPRGVYCDPSLLVTLPDREYRCGLGEVAKYALMGDDEMLAELRDNAAAVASRDPEVMSRIVEQAAAIKARYVSNDEFERTGLRAHLNYGHTFAHALEIVGEHALAHGEAVAVGLVFAAELAGALGRLDGEGVRSHAQLVTALGLPTRAPPGTSRAELVDVMRRDKKAAGGLTFVLRGPHGLERVDDPPSAALDTAFDAVGVDS